MLRGHLPSSHPYGPHKREGEVTARDRLLSLRADEAATVARGLIQEARQEAETLQAMLDREEAGEGAVRFVGGRPRFIHGLPVRFPS
jgi:hypothetical protein